MHEVYLSLGSNLADRVGNLEAAISLLKDDIKIEITAVSSVYETSPVGGIEQNNFLNLVIGLQTTYSATELLQLIHRIEQKLHRKRIIHWGPRTIDLDILYFDQVKIASKQLTVPHQEIGQRLFVLIPMLEICPANFYQHDYLVKQTRKLLHTDQEITKKEDMIIGK